MNQSKREYGTNGNNGTDRKACQAERLLPFVPYSLLLETTYMKKLIVFTLATGALLIAASCQRGNSTQNNQPTIALVLKTLNNPFY